MGTFASLAAAALAAPAGPGGARSDAPAGRLRAHWPIDPVRAERLFERDPLRVLSTEYAGRGITGARRVELVVGRARRRLAAKWKPAPRRLDLVNNSPRKEVAAYEVQKLFLAPRDFVVPTARLRCLRPAEYAGRRRIRPVTVRGTDCEIGVLSLWLDGVTLPAPLLDRDRFKRDLRYAERVADFNLAMYLIEHADGRRGNFLVAERGLPPRIFSVDNGVAFGGFFYNWFVPNWKKLRVPALRRESVERLRAVRRGDVGRLGVVAQLEVDARRHFVAVDPGPNLDPRLGVRFEGRTIQFGLAEDEIEALWQRIEHLLEDVDRGRVAVF